MSTGPSGVYLANLFQRLGIDDEITGKLKQMQGEPIGEVIARGEAEIGFQQVSELLPARARPRSASCRRRSRRSRCSTAACTPARSRRTVRGR